MIGIDRRKPMSAAGRSWCCLLALAWGCASDFPGHTPPDGSVADGDAGPDPDADGPSEACAQALAAAAFDFEAGPADWTHDLMPEIEGTIVDWNFDDWEHGTATNVGPAACHSGTGCWATQLDNYYIACQRAYLISPAIDLSACAGEEVALTWFHAYDFWSGEWADQTWFDGGLVELSIDGASWMSPPGLDHPGTIAINPRKGINECIESDNFYVDGKPGFIGANAGWEEVKLAIPADLVTAGLLVRFAYSSGVILQSGTQNPDNFSNAGWYIDDVAVVPAAAR
jgi:hypothetical protein